MHTHSRRGCVPPHPARKAHPLLCPRQGQVAPYFLLRPLQTVWLQSSLQGTVLVLEDSPYPAVFPWTLREAPLAITVPLW